MSYQVIARKWRPQTFDEVVFQDHISTTIRNSIKSGRISHAYLFAGPRGVGKTTMARIVAKSLNCAGGPTDSPCGKCDNCLEIRDGHSFDVIEIDGASNRGIENIRDLRENVAFAPVKARYKVYIIDEVHMLTKEAFNALLKTLEEPPPHIVFIFATTEIHQVPDTILSRCQKYFFRKMSVEAIVAHLNHIAGSEGFGIDESALYTLARAADGSMRDAQSLLDQVVSFSDGHIGEESALAILGVVPLESYLTILRFAAEGRADGAIREIDRVIGMGADIPRYVSGLAETVRALRLMKSGVDLQSILGLSAAEAASLREMTGRFNDEELSAVFRIMADLMREMRYAGSERILVEMAALDIIAVKNRPSIAAILGMLDSASPAPAKPSAAGATAEHHTEKKKTLTPADEAVPEPARPLPENRGPVPRDKVWAHFMRSAKEKKPYLFMKLSEAKPSFDGAILTILYPDDVDGSSFSRMLDSEDLSFIKEEVSRLAGNDVAVAAPPRRRRIQRPDEGTPGGAVPGDAVMVDAEVPGPAEEKNPMVDKLVELFHGQIMNNKGDS
ncbi:MAG TPA: DNA polymerase III subunit gamma/tau [Spirochaetota bacterium]|nr:DNA polymerase III subunit gamma/tau [Spirochaetota bacterium]